MIAALCTTLDKIQSKDTKRKTNAQHRQRGGRAFQNELNHLPVKIPKTHAINSHTNSNEKYDSRKSKSMNLF